MRKVSDVHPCFRGTCSDGENHSKLDDGTWFNPCFRGTCSDGPGIDGHRRDRRGVSILVFVELALDVKPFHGVRCECDSFQSLFSWNLLLMP